MRHGFGQSEPFSLLDLIRCRQRLLFNAFVLFGDESLEPPARDVDLVVVDESVGLGNGHLLPRGPLREPAWALGRATLIWVRASETPVAVLSTGTSAAAESGTARQ